MLQRLIQRYKDYQHEKKIARLQRECLNAETRELSAIAWGRFIAAINNRSPEQVKRMEKEKGLCR